jgi:hypothetical protein
MGDPGWGAATFSENAIVAKAAEQGAKGVESDPGGSQGLESAARIIGYHVHALDGELGHVENLLADDAGWDIRYLVIATRSWWPGKTVRLAPHAVTAVDRADGEVKLNVTRDQVKSAPAWDPLTMADEVGEQQLRRHFGWPR